MGNRAVITTKKDWETNGLGVYLHWNGGRDSVGPFLKYCKLRGFRTPEYDCYGWARLCQIISNFFGNDGLCIGIERLENLDCDNWDNGVYITEGWEIVERKYMHGDEQNEYDEQKFLEAIDAVQPLREQLWPEKHLEHLQETLNNLGLKIGQTEQEPPKEPEEKDMEGIPQQINIFINL